MAETRYRSPCAILNPRAASGRVLRLWPDLRARLEGAVGSVRVCFTEAPNHASELAREAIAAGADLVIAVGGDGTLNEVLNGYFADGAPASPQACLGLCPIGTGGDFRRGAGIPASCPEAIEALARLPSRRVDALRVRFRSREGVVTDRYCLNVASFGLGGQVSVAAKNSFLTPYSGKSAFLWATVTSFLRYRAVPVRLRLGGEPGERCYRIMQVALGNGMYHGGGMHVCPQARLDSGTMEVTIIEELGLFNFLRSLPLLYSGKIYSHPRCHQFRADRLSADSDATVLAEVDGEAIGALPLEAEVLPGAVLMAGIDPRSRPASNQGLAES